MGSLSNEAQHLSVLFIRQTNYTYFIMSANFFVRLPSGACIIYIPRSNTHTYIRGENVLLLAQLLICNLSNLPLTNPTRIGGVYATSLPSFKLCRDASLNINFLHYSQFKQFIL